MTFNVSVGQTSQRRFEEVHLCAATRPTPVIVGHPRQQREMSGPARITQQLGLLTLSRCTPCPPSAFSSWASLCVLSQPRPPHLAGRACASPPDFSRKQVAEMGVVQSCTITASSAGRCDVCMPYQVRSKDGVVFRVRGACTVAPELTSLLWVGLASPSTPPSPATSAPSDVTAPTSRPVGPTRFSCAAPTRTISSPTSSSFA